jgi:DnaJ-class molecular chaperone
MDVRLNGELEPCPYCAGDGLVRNDADELVPCPECKGSAVVDPALPAPARSDDG